jgi:hypothetical protein
MTFKATAIEVMLASPGDVKDERVTARKVIAQWNAEHSRQTGTVLLPMGWESHAGSDVSGTRPQQLINQHLVKHADLMIGIFWTRLGSPTGAESSGTVEEVKLHHGARKPLMLFFSDAAINPSRINAEQYEQVKRFREWAKSEGYVSSYSDASEFAELFRRDLAHMLKNNEWMRQLIVGETIIPQVAISQLSPNAQKLLQMICSSAKGQLTVQRREGNIDTLKWRAALGELLEQDLLTDKTGRQQFYELTPKASTQLPLAVKSS